MLSSPSHLINSEATSTDRSDLFGAVLYMRDPDPISLAELGGCPEIDVHGYDVSGAIFEVSAFAERLLDRHSPVVKIQHGRGSGKLREALLAWAKRSGYRVQDSSVPFETGAVLYVCRKTL